MFRKLRIKFIVTATAAIALILAFFLVLMNSIVYTQTEDNIQTVLSILSKNEGELPITDETKENFTKKNIQEERKAPLRVVEASGVPEVVLSVGVPSSRGNRSNSKWCGIPN